MVGVIIIAAGAAVSLTVLWLSRRFVVVTVGGFSMAPTYAGGERVLVQRTPPATIDHGKIVVVEVPIPDDAVLADDDGHPEAAWEPEDQMAPTDSASPRPERYRWRQAPHGRRVSGRMWMIKRAVALPGDPTPADFAAATGVPAGAPVPPGHVLVAGDNTSRSYDSRTFGYVPMERVLGIGLRTMAEIAG